MFILCLELARNLGVTNFPHPVHPITILVRVNRIRNPLPLLLQPLAALGRSVEFRTGCCHEGTVTVLYGPSVFLLELSTIRVGHPVGTLIFQINVMPIQQSKLAVDGVGLWSV